MDSDGGSDELMGKGGQGVQTLESSHGWKKVVNTKKARRQQDVGMKSAGSGVRNAGNNAAETRIFHVLEKEVGQKKALKEALLRAYQQDLAASSAVPTHSDNSEDDIDDAEDKSRVTNTDLEKKSKIKKQKKPKVTVVEAASSIDAADLASFLAQISDLFATSPDVQLMRLADYFVKAFNLVTPMQFGWNKILKESSLAKALEVPLCYIHESVVKIASDWLATMPLDALGNFLIWGLTDVLSDMLPAKGSKSLQHKTKVGVLVVLALTSRKRSEALLHIAAALRTKPEFQGQEKLTFLAWAYGQAAQGDLVAGMQVWVQNLLPLACGKASTPASRDVALQFAESIIFSDMKKSKKILQNGASRKGERLVPPGAFDALMHATFPSAANRTKATERFEGIYPSLKELALFGPRSSKATRAVAQQLLPVCLESASEDASALISEACSIFIWCLSENPDCFKLWEKLYLERLKGSITVMSFMCKEWSVVADRLAPLDELRNTISIIREKNLASLKNVKLHPKLEMMLGTADRHAKVLKRKSARVGSCFKTMAAFMAGVGIIYGFYWLNFDLPAVM